MAGEAGKPVPADARTTGWIGRHRQKVKSWIDELWGDDVFIAHRRADGKTYARALAAVSQTVLESNPTQALKLALAAWSRSEADPYLQTAAALSAFDLACRWLPDFELADITGLYGLTIDRRSAGTSRHCPLRGCCGERLSGNGRSGVNCGILVD